MNPCRRVDQASVADEIQGACQAYLIFISLNVEDTRLVAGESRDPVSTDRRKTDQSPVVMAWLKLISAASRAAATVAGAVFSSVI